MEIVFTQLKLVSSLILFFILYKIKSKMIKILKPDIKLKLFKVQHDSWNSSTHQHNIIDYKLFVGVLLWSTGIIGIKVIIETMANTNKPIKKLKSVS